MRNFQRVGRVMGVWACLAAFTFAAAGGAEAGGQKKLIEFGWDEPDTAFMRAHAAEMDKTPFDGCVFHATATDAQGKAVPFLWEGWGKRGFTQEQLRASLEDLKAAKFSRLKHNFVRFNTSPADVDWFDDHSAIVNNARLVAWFAKEGGCAGILFDTEQYNNPLFNYAKQRDAKTKSWDQYAAQVRLRGREVMRAFQEGYPDVTLFLTFAYSMPFRQAKSDPRGLPRAQYGLLVPFLDGMLDEAKGKTRIVDGYELSYAFKDPGQFAGAYETMSKGVLPVVADSAKYREHFSFGFGVWLDRDWRRVGWNVADPSTNFFTPEALEKSVKAALGRSDEFVWIYSETPRWWTAAGGAEKLPEAYDRAVRRAAGSK